MKFVVFLRGINVGGHHKVPMAELKTLLKSMGFSSIKTFLASGNIVLEGGEELVLTIQKRLEQHFGFSIPCFIIPFEKLQKLVESAPFDTVEAGKKIKHYVTFSADGVSIPKPLPWSSGDGSFQIILQQESAVYSFIDLEKGKTTDAMKVLEKFLGKNITTRNINTLEKIVAA